MHREEEEQRHDSPTLPQGSPTAGEAAARKQGVERDEPKAGKGGDHPTPGAGDQDDPSN
jgi:hypothetical protein